MIAVSHNQQDKAIESASEDILLLTLMAMAKLHSLPVSESSPVAGLPLVDGKLTPQLFVRAAKRVGLSARVVQKPLTEINDLLLPVVLILEDNHACILLKRHPENQLEVLYPETGDGAAKVSADQLEALYSGYAILATPEHDFGQQGRQKLTSGGHWFWGTMSMSWRIYRDVLLASFLINLFAIVNPLFVMNVYDRVVPNNAKETLWVLAIGVGIVVVFDFLLRLTRSRFIDIAGKKADVILSSKLLERVLGMKLSARPASVGLFANNFREFDGIRDFITSVTISTLIDLPFVFIFLLVIYILAGPLVIIPLLAIPVILVYGFSVQKALQQAAEQASQAASRKSALLIESLTIAETVKANAAESIMQSRWEQAVGQLAKWDAKSRYIANSASSLASFVQQFVTLAVVVYGVYLLQEGNLSMGGLIASVMLAGRSVAPMAQVSLLATRYHQSKAALTTLNSMMQLPVERPEGKHFLSRPHIKGDIDFENVTFSYPNTDNAVLKNISFNIKAAEKVAIIGRIGSGKSTIEKLLLGLYQVEDGAVRIDGVDMRQLDPADLRRHIGYVPQDITLINGTVRENITIGTTHVSDLDVIEAAEMAGVANFVNQHPMGFDMQVGERGEQLSGGQRQAVALARAIVNRPSFLLLDEPTSSMDNASEEVVKQKLAGYIDNRTLVLVTHRASMLKLVDRIIVMDAGRIIADGPKDKILDALKNGQIQTGG